MDYLGMLEDLKAMRKRAKNRMVRPSQYLRESKYYHAINDFMAEINELLASEEAYRRG